MVVETSAVLAILLEEPEAAEFAQLIEDDPAPLISAASVVEAGIVLISRHGPDARDDLRDFLAQGGLQVEPVTAEQAELALEAYQRYGKGRHRAGLNFGDCFAYALCKATSQPLLEGVSELWICSILCMYLRGAAWPPDHEVLWL